nr:MAG TPA: hypothetical protein [Caudoviricetes sp.]
MGVNNFGKIQSNPNNSYKYSNKGYKNCSSNLRKTKIWHPKPLPNLWQVHAKEIGVTTCDGAHTDSCKAARNSSGQYI